MKCLGCMAVVCLATPNSSQSFGRFDESSAVGVGICCAIVVAVCGITYMSSTSDKKDFDKDKSETAADAIEAIVSPPMADSGVATTLSRPSRREVLYIAGATAGVLAAGYGAYHMLGTPALATPPLATPPLTPSAPGATEGPDSLVAIGTSNAGHQSESGSDDSNSLVVARQGSDTNGEGLLTSTSENYRAANPRGSSDDKLNYDPNTYSYCDPNISIYCSNEWDEREIAQDDGSRQLTTQGSTMACNSSECESETVTNNTTSPPDTLLSRLSKMMEMASGLRSVSGKAWLLLGSMKLVGALTKSKQGSDLLLLLCDPLLLVTSCPLSSLMGFVLIDELRPVIDLTAPVAVAPSILALTRWVVQVLAMCGVPIVVVMAWIKTGAAAQRITLLLLASCLICRDGISMKRCNQIPVI